MADHRNTTGKTGRYARHFAIAAGVIAGLALLWHFVPSFRVAVRGTNKANAAHACLRYRETQMRDPGNVAFVDSAIAKGQVTVWFHAKNAAGTTVLRTTTCALDPQGRFSKTLTIIAGAGHMTPTQSPPVSRSGH